MGPWDLGLFRRTNSKENHKTHRVVTTTPTVTPGLFGTLGETVDGLVELPTLRFTLFSRDLNPGEESFTRDTR